MFTKAANIILTKVKKKKKNYIVIILVRII